MRRLARDEWSPFCVSISKGLDLQRLDVKVTSLLSDSSGESAWAPLFGISFDPDADTFEVALSEVDHVISDPREVRVDYAFQGVPTFEDAHHHLTTVEIIDTQGVLHTLVFLYRSRPS